MKVALVYDYLNQYGGGERVLEVLMEMFPSAPIYTLLYDPGRLPEQFKNKKIITSFLDKIPLAKNHHRLFFPLMPRAVERWDFSGFDLVISISASFAKGVRISPPTRHICYLLTPTRFLWDEAEQRLQEELFPVARPLARLLVEKLKKWDFEVAQRPDVIIPISEHIKKEIETKYQRSTAAVIYPPVDVARFKSARLSSQGQDFLIVSRLIPYKRIDIAIQACERIGVNLKIIGVGRDLRRLKRLAGKHTDFLGAVSDRARDRYLAGAKAFLMPQKEDFGMAAAEAQASGTPIIAYQTGGALEIIEDSRTGIFFDRQTPESLAEAVRRFESMSFNREKISARARKFSKENFQKQFLDIIKKIIV